MNIFLIYAALRMHFIHPGEKPCLGNSPVCVTFIPTAEIIEEHPFYPGTEVALTAISHKL